MGRDVFVSYANRDKPTAVAIVTKLEEHDISCWLAPRDIPAGQGFAESITEAIEQCRLMVVVLSQPANESAYVLNEVNEALNLRKKVLPIRIEDIEPNKEMRLFVSRTQRFDAFEGDPEEALDRLAAVVKDIIAEPVSPPRSPFHEFGRQLRDAVPSMVAGLALILMILGVQWLVSKRDVGDSFRRWTYDHLYGSADRPGDRSVELVNYGTNIQEPEPGSNVEPELATVKVTDPKKLERLIRQIAECQPIAIGVDMDFGPHRGPENEKISVFEGTDFLPVVKGIARKNHVKVFLGTNGTEPGSPDLLMDEEASNPKSGCPVQAASLWIPLPAPNGQVTMMLGITKNGITLPSLAEALAEAYPRKDADSRSTWFRSTKWPDESDASDKKDGPWHETESFLINYADKDRLASETLQVDTRGNLVSSDLARERLHGKLVVVGSTDDPDDMLPQPGSSDRISGAMLDALATETRLSSPLYRVTGLGEAFLIGSAALLLSLVVTGIRAWRATTGQPFRTYRDAGLATIGVMVLAYELCKGLAGSNVLWLDVWLILLLPFLHPRVVDRLVASIRSRIRTTAIK